MRYKVRYQWGKKGGCVTVEAEDEDAAIAMTRDSIQEQPGRAPRYYSFQIVESWEEGQPPPEDDCPPWWTERGHDVSQRESD